MNTMLGKYDMVLSLSESKINHHFAKLLKRKLIHPNWAFLTNLDGTEHVQDEREVQEKKENWKKLKIKIDQLDQLKEERRKYEDLEDEALEKGDDKAADKYHEKARELRKEIRPLENQVKDLSKYKILFDTKIKAPKIEIINQSPRELFFEVGFEKGSKLFYLQEGVFTEVDLTDMLYAFNVPIGKVKITDQQKVIVIDEKTEKVKTLREMGLSDNDFTIESLFLDFESANINNFDEHKSILPKEALDKTFLQGAIVNYFKNLSGTKNPYVLGYPVQKKQLENVDPAMLQPTGMTYSTSFSTEKRASALNFLMLLRNHAFPTGGNAGVLPTSLMEKALDKTSTVNAVLGIDYPQFKDIYISKLNKNLGNKLYHSLSQKGFSSISTFTNGHVEAHFRKHNLEGCVLRLIPHVTSCNESPYGIIINYEVQFEARVHRELKMMIGTVGTDWVLSTNGRHHGTGHAGNLSIKIYTNNEGKLSIAPPQFTSFKLAMETEKPHYRNPGDEFWKDINKLVKTAVKIFTGASLDLQDEFAFIEDVVSLDYLVRTFDFSGFENMENKVVLPVSSRYMYKNLRVSEGSNDKTVLVDASYINN